MTFYRKRVFPILAGLLWVVFLTLDLTEWGDSTWIKFVAICLCCVTALLGAKTTDGRLVAVALCFTVAADWFLLVVGDHYELGLGLFIVVQLIYGCRLYLLRDEEIHKLGALRLCILFPGLSWAFVSSGITCGGGTPLYVIFSLLYFSNLVINAAEAFAQKQRTFALGLLLFVCCDICVGAYNLDLLPALSFPGMWFFYLPSQVLIVLSQETGDTNEKAL